MDNHQWDHHHLNSNAQREPPRHTSSMSTEAIPAINGYGHVHEREMAGAPEWKRRQYPAHAVSNHWDVQADWWLTQQNHMPPMAATYREDRSQSSQASEPEPAISRVGSVNQTYNWPRRLEDADMAYSNEGRLVGSREAVAMVPFPTKASGSSLQPVETPTPNRELYETAAPQPRKAATNLTEMEKRCEKCSHSEGLLRECSASFSKLADSVSSSSLTETMGQARKEGLSHDKTPCVSELHRILDLLHEANGLAKQIVNINPLQLQNARRNSPLETNDSQHSSLETMKRRFLAESQDVRKRQRRQSSDTNSGLEIAEYNASPGFPESNAPGGSLGLLSTPISSTTNSDVLPPIRSQSPSHMVGDGYGTRLPSMKPPPTPGRQIPSPPGRSQPSPLSYSAPSPSSVISPQYVGAAGVAGTILTAQSSAPHVLHPSSPTPSSALGSTTAIQAHTAALQHEVSVKKYALQSLQSEHDKLLAAFRRSQTRARALEDKQVASDLEINNLAEERVRLLTQAQELEQSIADVSKSRDEFRQAAVKGGAQYVEMIRKASQLEIIAGDERRELKRKLGEQQVTKTAYKSPSQGSRPVGDSTEPTTGLSNLGSEDVEDLRREVQHLRNRCAEMETTLRNIHNGSNRFSETVANLSDYGEKIFESVNTALGKASSLEIRKCPELPYAKPERSVSLIMSPP